MKKKILVAMVSFGILFGISFSSLENVFGGIETVHAATDNRTRRVLSSYDVKFEYRDKNGKKLKNPKITKFNYKYKNVSIHARYIKEVSKNIGNFPLVDRHTLIYR